MGLPSRPYSLELSPELGSQQQLSSWDPSPPCGAQRLGVRGGVCRQSLTRKARTLAASLRKPFSHPSYQVALATNSFLPLLEMGGTLVITIPLSTNKHHPLSQDAQPRRLQGDQTSLPHPGARGLSMPPGLASMCAWDAVQWPKLGEGSHWPLRCMAVKWGWRQA